MITPFVVKFLYMDKIPRRTFISHQSALAWSKLYQSVDMWLSCASQTWLSNWNLRHLIKPAYPGIVIHSTSYLFLWDVCPINTIARAVPRIPMSRLFMSIDFMRDPLIKFYEKQIFTKSRIWGQQFGSEKSLSTSWVPVLLYWTVLDCTWVDSGAYKRR